MKKGYLAWALALVFIIGSGFSGNRQHASPNHILQQGDVANILQSIPSPLEVSSLIKEVGGKYDPNHLNPTKSVENYTMTYKKALNLGIYSTDLGYANLYDQRQDILNYLDAVKGLADGLGIGQFFDYEQIKKLANSSNNIPELLKVTQQNFEKITDHLATNRRESVSVLILAGGWVEALYLTTLVYESTKDARLKEKIGEQKIALEQIRKVMNLYSDKPNFKGIIRDLEQLSLVYKKVNITTKDGKPVVSENGGVLTIEDGTITDVEISDNDLATISSLARGIRDKMIK